MPAVVTAVRDDRPAVVPARSDDVDFVAAHRAILRFPDLTGLRMDEQPDRVANTERIDFGKVSWFADERIVLRNAPVVVQTQHLPHVIRWILRIFGGADRFPHSRPNGDNHLTV